MIDVKTFLTKNTNKQRRPAARKPVKQQSKRRAQAKNVSMGRGGMKKSRVNRPIVNGTVVRNVAVSQSVTLRGQETVGTFQFMNSAEFASIGEFPVGEYDLSPLAYRGTRLASLASAFQKFRFKAGTKFVIQNQAPTISTGGYCAGYTENPDQAMGQGQAAQNNISNLQGAVFAPIWESAEIPVHIGDKAKWYNVDADTEEIMMAIQGKFVFTQTSPTSVLTDPGVSLSSPIWLEYVIEFCGNASQNTDDSVFETEKQLPPGEFVAPTGSTDTLFNGFGLKYNVFSVIPNTLAPNVLYEMIPGVETHGGESANYVWTYTFGSSGGYLLAKSEDEAMDGIFLSNQEACGPDNKLVGPGSLCYPLWFGQPVHITRAAASERFTGFSNRVAKHKSTKTDRMVAKLVDQLAALKSSFKDVSEKMKARDIDADGWSPVILEEKSRGKFDAGAELLRSMQFRHSDQIRPNLPLN